MLIVKILHCPVFSYVSEPIWRSLNDHFSASSVALFPASCALSLSLSKSIALDADKVDFSVEGHSADDGTQHH